MLPELEPEGWQAALAPELPVVAEESGSYLVSAGELAAAEGT
jgi:hypothetical protein